MSISRISFTSETNLLNNIRPNPSVCVKTPELPKDEVVIKNKAKKNWLIGLGVGVTIIALAILGRIGKLGTSVQRWLGGLKKSSPVSLEPKQKLLPTSTQQSSNIEILEAEVVDTTRLPRRSKLRMKPVIEDAEFVEL